MINIAQGHSGNTDTHPSRKGGGVAAVLFILAVFLLCRIPIATEYYNYHSDEAFYTDNALEMLHRGDYITPYHTDGTARFDKPPITCWVVVLGFKLFGISILSSRLLFLLIGALTVWLTYRVARTLLDYESSAVLASLIMVSNATFMYHAGYALTDGLLTLSVLIAHFGFVRVLLLEQRTATSFACAYIGTGMAFFVKGLPGLLPLPFAFGFALWLFSRSERTRLRIFPRELLSVPWMLAGLCVATGWIIAESYLRGHEFWHGFLYDQAGRRFERTQMLTNVFTYPLNVFQVFLPWTMPLFLLLIRYRAELRAYFQERRVLYCYLLGACVLQFVFFAPININRSRYLMPVFPLFSIFLAGILSQAAQKLDLAKFWRTIALSFGTAGMAGALILLVSSPHDRPLTSALLLLAGGGALIASATVRPATAPAGLAAFMIFSYSALDYFEWPVVAPAPSAEVSRVLEEHGLLNTDLALGREIMYELPPQVRVISGGRMSYARLPDFPADRPPVVLIKETCVPLHLDLAGYTIVPVGYGYFRSDEKFGPVRIGRNADELMFFLCFLSHDPTAFTSRYRCRYLLAIRNDR